MLNINKTDLKKWLSIPRDQLENHPDRKMNINICNDSTEADKLVAKFMAEEIATNNKSDLPTRWIIMAGPESPFPYFAELINSGKISMKNVHVFHMDDFLDWQGRHLQVSHRFSLEGKMRKVFYGRINEELNVPENQRHFPRLEKLNAISEEIDRLGGVDTVWGGIGMCGHVAFNEPPRWKWTVISLEEFANTGTHIVPLNDDTILNIAVRSKGSCAYMIPPMGITIGMKDMLKAKRTIMLSTSGKWKHNIMRIALFSEPNIDYPVTLMQRIPNALIISDKDTTQCIDWCEC
jgi:glucosamine-6-phosphate deaminase